MTFTKIPNIEFSDHNVIITIIFFIAFLIARSILLAAMKKWSFVNNEERRRWTINLKNILFFIFVVGVIFIWGPELRAFAISLVAVAAAVVIATKEIILCLMGGVLKASTKLFVIGDRIEVKGLRGVVTDHNFLVTVLFEIGPGSKSNQFTGRTLKVPNSLFLVESVVVEPSGNHFCLSVFRILLVVPKSIKKVESILLESAHIVSRPYHKDASEYIQNICQREGVDTPFLDPRVFYEMKDKDTLEFHVRMPVPFSHKSKTEKKLLDTFFEKYEEVVKQDDALTVPMKSEVE